jgi:hypothetical protein
MKKQLIYILFILVFPCLQVSAQKDLNFDENIRRLIEGNLSTQDTIISHQDTTSFTTTTGTGTSDEKTENESDALQQKKEPDIQLQTPQRPRRRAPLQMSDEALYWSRYATNSYNRFGPFTTYRDTIIVNPLFMPPVFKKGHIMPPDSILPYKRLSLTEETWNNPEYKPVKILEEQALKLQLQDMAYRYIQYKKPYIFDHTAESLPSEKIGYIRQTKKTERYVRVERIEPSPNDLDAPVKFIPDRQYWTSSFESSLKFSENYASDNWYKGGTETAILNIFTKNAFQYNYEKEKVKINNKIEVNASLYNAPKDTIHGYKVGDDLLRLYSTLGFKAFSKWHYTFNAEFTTQMFPNFQENDSTFKQAAFLAPFTVKFGLGMEYNYKKQYKRKDRSLNLLVNISPISYSYMHTVRDTIDFGRYGFPKDETTGKYNRTLSQFGSNIRFEMTLKPNWKVTWKSQLNYFTSYERVVCDFENSLDLAVSRYFSTLIYLNLRYDDGIVKPKPDSKYLQINQLLSFGLSYKW